MCENVISFHAFKILFC